ncbi:hypothetical protein FQN57_001053 [Myotisia sp. PD_48]|nr:hypothetical protein FQN57_001053 [Myotisia sp. PD_48]
MSPQSGVDPAFPFSLTISVPFPSNHLASSALRALQVDTELSSFVHRSFSLSRGNPTITAPTTTTPPSKNTTEGIASEQELSPEKVVFEGNKKEGEKDSDNAPDGDPSLTVLVTEYKATTNRMLRVAVNSFMESLGVVVGVMEELDIDVLNSELGK